MDAIRSFILRRPQKRAGGLLEKFGIIICVVLAGLVGNVGLVWAQEGGGPGFRAQGQLGGNLVLGAGGTNAGGASVEPDEFTGAATHSVKIPVPPARGGIEPNLNLNYNSHRKNPNSWVGYGWELDLGAVTRVSEAGSIDYYNGTNFAVRFGGQSESLVRVQENVDLESYGLEAQPNTMTTRYRSRIEGSFNIYLHVRDVRDPLRIDDKGWIVIDKSGIRYFFGLSNTATDATAHLRIPGDPNSAQTWIARWFLQRVVDPNGNTLNISYNFQRHVRRITYDDIRIDFDVRNDDPATPIFPAYREALLRNSQLGNRLANITVYQDQERLQRFSFGYEVAPRQNALRLSQITQYGRRDANRLPITHFDYYEIDQNSDLLWDGHSFDRQVSRSNNLGEHKGFMNEFSVFADMNGDGLPDQVVTYEDSQIMHVFFNNGNDFVFIPNKSVWQDPIDFTCNLDTWCIGRLNAYSRFSGINAQIAFLLDMNGDGLPDRMYIGHVGDQRYRIWIAFNNGRSFDAPVIWDDPYVGPWVGQDGGRVYDDNQKFFMDMNGDRLPDRVIGDHDNRQYRVHYNTGNGFEPEATIWHDPSVNPDNPGVGRQVGVNDGKIIAFIRDMNGDGLPDRVLRSRFDDDHLGFLISFNVNGTHWAPTERQEDEDVFIINGVTTTVLIDDEDVDNDQKGYVSDQADWMDFNGDGYLDRIVGNTDNGQFKVYFFQGSRPNEPAQLSSGYVLQDRVQDVDGEWDGRGFVRKGRHNNGRGVTRWHTMIMDLNGDGFPDRWSLSPRNDNDNDDANRVMKFYPLRFEALQYSDTPQDWVNTLVNQPVGALKSVDDGTGGYTKIEYLPSSWPRRWPQPNHRYLPFNLFVPHKIYVKDYTLPRVPSNTFEGIRNPGMSWTTYDFWGGYYFVHEEITTFNGFQKVIKTRESYPGEEEWQLTTTSIYHQGRGNIFPADLDNVFESTAYTHLALAGKPYTEEILPHTGARIFARNDWVINADPGEYFECNGACLPQLGYQLKLVRENAEEDYRTSKVAFVYDDLGNVFNRINLTDNNQILLETITEYYPSDQFDLPIRDRPSSQTQKLGLTNYRYKEFEYDAKGNPVLEKYLTGDDDEGQPQFLRVEKSFHDNGNLNEQIDIDGVKKVFVYDDDAVFPIEESIDLQDGNLLTTTREYVRFTGKVEQETNPSNISKRVERDDFGRPVDEYIIGRNNNRVLTSHYDYEYADYNVDGREGVTLLRVVRWEPQPGYPDTNVDQTPSQIAYQDNNGNVLQACTFTERGNYRRVLHRVKEGGRTAVQAQPVFVDDCNFLSNIPDGSLLTVVKKDFQGRAIRQELPPGDVDSPVGVATFSYRSGERNSVIKTSSFEGRVKVETFDEKNNLISLNDNGNDIDYSYDAVGNLVAVRSDGDVLARLEYDVLGRKTVMTDANSGTWRYEHDENGQMVKQTDARGHYIRNVYTSMGRVLRKEVYNHLDELQKKIVFSYDSGDASHSVMRGELFQVEEFDAQDNLLLRTQFSYENSFRRQEKITRFIPGVGEVVQRFEYDSRGRKTRETYPGGESINYFYTRIGQVEKICRTDQCGDDNDLYYSIDASNAYDADGALLTESYGNGVETAYDYYPNSRRLRSKRSFLADKVYSHRSYQYDAYSNITRIDDSLNSPGSGGFSSLQYDRWDRLVSYRRGNDNAFTMEYDDNGNIIRNSENYGNQAYQYNSPRPHAVTNIGDEQFVYDANGNMTSDASRRMIYDSENKLTRVEMQNGTRVDYSYDYTDARIGKKVVRQDPHGRFHESNTYYFGNDTEIRNGLVLLHIHVGGRRMATKSLGKLQDLQGGGGAGLIDPGITLPFNFAQLFPFASLLFVLFLLASLRPVERMPRWAYFSLCRSIVGPPVRKVINLWASYTHLVQDTIRFLHYRTSFKLITFFLAFLTFIQIPLTAIADPAPPRNPIPISDELYFVYHHGDHLGSSHIITEGKDESKHSGVIYKKGQLLQRFEYKPFGKEHYVLNPNLKFDPRYTDQTYDIETGLYYYKARYYNPQLGRFIQPDSLVPEARNVQAYNKYSYVMNNPMKYTDPSGHGFWSFLGKLLGVFVIAAISVALAIVTAGALAPALAASLPAATATFWAAVIGGAVGGLVGGAIGGAMSGGIKGALYGALFGAISGAVFGGVGQGLKEISGVGQITVKALMTGAGAGLSYRAGGWKGLITFGVGMLGTLAGGQIGNALLPEQPIPEPAAAAEAQQQPAKIKAKVEAKLQQNVTEGQYGKLEIPPGVDIAQNIEEAKKISLFEFIDRVKTKGAWDFKNLPGALPGQYENFGNYHFGIVGTAHGFSPTALKFGAGVYQIWQGNSTWGWYNSFFDDPIDQYWIQQGINDFSKY